MFSVCFSAPDILTRKNSGTYNTAKAMIKASSRIMAAPRDPRILLRAGKPRKKASSRKPGVPVRLQSFPRSAGSMRKARSTRSITVRSVLPRSIFTMRSLRSSGANRKISSAGSIRSADLTQKATTGVRDPALNKCRIPGRSQDGKNRRSYDPLLPFCFIRNRYFYEQKLYDDRRQRSCRPCCL